MVTGHWHGRVGACGIIMHAQHESSMYPCGSPPYSIAVAWCSAGCRHIVSERYRSVVSDWPGSQVCGTTQTSTRVQMLLLITISVLRCLLVLSIICVHTCSAQLVA